MKNTEKAAYIKGLMEGLELNPDAKETKVLNSVVELLNELSATVEKLQNEIIDMNNLIDEIDEDLSNLSDEMFGDEDGECSCGHSHDD